jgi:hypothetical protein
MTLFTYFLLSLYALPSLVFAHGHIAAVIVDGVKYAGYDPNNPQRGSTPVGWTTKQTEDWSVNSDQVGSPDIICHKAATPAKAYATAKPGSQITIQYNNWPDTHPGPALAYLADCGGDCTTVNKTQLKWVKFWQKGENAQGVWINTQFMSDNYRMTIPFPNIKPGNYVMRHELINLYLAKPGHTEMYPQCVNFIIGGNGTEAITGGVLGTELYKSDDPGLLDPGRNYASYKFPGPPLTNFTFL